jgi:D-alanyl-lipoteichoic acid acyltransferase DltB (MBOAT superfamily)
MNIVSPIFVLFFLSFIFLFNLRSSIGWKRAVSIVANLIFLGSFAQQPLNLIPIILFLVYCYACIEIVRRGVKLPIFVAILVSTLLVFVSLKQYSFVPTSLELAFPYVTIGLSYILFRVLHMLIDMRSGDIAGPVRPIAFFNYTCNFLTLISGPIQRFQDFQAQTEAAPKPLTDEVVRSALGRIIKGFVNVAALSAIANYLFTNRQEALFAGDSVGLKAAIEYMITAVCYTFYLYSNFAGYMDIVIGIGKLTGQDLPENFNKPFKSRNFLEFWSRWHITLSNWFRLYLFNPLLRLMMTHITDRRLEPYLGVVAFFVTFLVMGVWHGPTAIFVVYGCIMGAGVSLNKLWQVVMTKRLGRKGYKALSDNPVYEYLCVGMTFGFYVMAITCLWVDLPQFMSILKALGVGGVLFSFAVLTAAAAAIAAIWETLAKQMQGATAKVSDVLAHPLVNSFALSAQILLVVATMSFFHKAPEFVYRAF